MAPRLVFGIGVLGMDNAEFQDSNSVTNLLRTLRQLGINRLDTAARYPPFNTGKSEELIGAAKELSDAFLIDTKVYNEVGDGSGDLTRAATQKSVDGSLERLKRPQVNVLFAHRPDPATSLEEQVQGFQDQIAQGHAKEWGVANHSPETLQKIVDLCEQKGWVKPTWYQGTCNMLTRGMETHAGNHVDADGNPTGRFANNSSYASQEVVAAMKEFVEDCKAHRLPPLEVASRWIAHHSALSESDDIVLGASKLVQVGDAVANVRKGPISAEVVALADGIWDAVKDIRGSML